MQKIEIPEEIFAGAISLERKDAALKPWRLPHDDLELFPPNSFLQAAEMPAGVRLRFSSNTENICLKFIPADMQRKFDLVIDNKIVKTSLLPPEQRQVVYNNFKNDEEKIMEVWFPQGNAVEMEGLYLDEKASFNVPIDSRLRWVTYGSSISHCGSAESPAQTWPAIVARGNNLNLTCLGYSGNCHLEAMVARMIRDLPADFISLKIGINIYGHLSLGPRTFAAAVMGFIKIIREKQRHVPLVVISPIISPPRETTENILGLNLAKIRESMAKAVRILRKKGDANLYYFNGLDLFGQEFATDYLPDNLHPDAEGYKIIAKNFKKVVLSKIRSRNKNLVHPVKRRF